MTWASRRMAALGEQYREMSSKSLARVWAWTEGNPEHPLAQAYEAACFALATVQDLSGDLTPEYDNASGANAVDTAFFHRDTLGRTILRALNSGKL